MEIVMVVKQMLVLLILLIVGVIAAKTGVVDEETNRRLTRFALMIPQTCMILGSVMNADLGMTPLKVLSIMGIGFLMYAILIALSLVSPYICGCPREDRGVYRFMTIFGNVGFMGYPVVRAIFGSNAVFYAAVLNLPFNLLAYSLGISLLRGGHSIKSFDKKQLISPPMIASFLVLILACVPIKFPEPLVDAVDYLGNMIVPCSMIIIGASLGSQKVKAVFGDLRTYAFAPIRLLICPVVLWGLLHFIIRDEMLLGVVTVLGATPVAAFATMLSIEYGGNEKAASRCVFVTTVLSVATIPFIYWLLPV